jgi:hypothetical protein
MKLNQLISLFELSGARSTSNSLLVAFWTTAGSLLVVLLYCFWIDASWRTVGAGTILIAALSPAYVWCTGKAPGLPIFPIFCITFVLTYALPLATGHPIVVQYSETDGLLAGLTVALFLTAAAAAWFITVRVPKRGIRQVRAMAYGRGDYVFCLIICAAALLTLALSGGWIDLGAALFSVIRAALFGLASVGVFVLAFRFGARELDIGKSAAFLGGLSLYIVAQVTSLLLVSAMVASVVTICGFILGSKRVPWRALLMVIALFSILHAGKAEMRGRYWYPEPVAIQLWHVPVLLGEWIAVGAQSIVSPRSDAESQPLYERLSLVHLLLKVQDESPQKIPYLLGETYIVIPYLLVPRILNPEKLSAHEGTTMLNVHYGLQTREDAERTTIGWGLLNEAMANFGVAGAFMLAILIGAAYGWVTRFALGMPVLSLPTLVAITFVAFAAQTEFTAGVYVSALFQSLVSLFGLSIVFMERQFVVLETAQ